MVTYQINARTYIGGVQFIKYGGNYYIWNLNSPLGNTNGFCYVTPTEEWED